MLTGLVSKVQSLNTKCAASKSASPDTKSIGSSSSTFDKSKQDKESMLVERLHDPYCSFENDLQPEIIRHIFTFVGGYEYRFMCNISKTFRQRYIEQYPDKLTSHACAGLSVHHAKVYFDECKLSKDYQDGFIPGYSQSAKEKKKLETIIEQAILQKNFNIFEWLFSLRDMEKFYPYAFDYAAEIGNVDFIQYLYNRKNEILFYSSIAVAARNGHLDALKFLCSKYTGDQNPCPYVQNGCFGYVREICCSSAAGGGHLECLRYLHEHGFQFFNCVDPEMREFKSTFLKAAEGGDIDCIKYMHEHDDCKLNRIDQRIMREAAKKSFKCFEYLYSHNYKWDEYDCFCAAAKGGNIECLTFIYDIIHPNFSDTNVSYVELCLEAARAGSLECLKFLHEKGCPWNKVVSSVASRAGSIDCLRYLTEHGCPVDQKCTLEAATHGFIECLRYLHEHGCKWNFEECCREAAKNGHLSCLQYLHENGRQLSSSLYCDCMESCCDWPRTGLSCLQYLKDMGVQTPLKAVNDAIEYKLEDMFEYFNLEEMINDIENGNEAFLKAIRDQWLFPSLHKLYKEEWKQDAIYSQTAARCGDLNMLKYLLDKGFQVPDNICVEAAKGGNIECLKFLHEKGFALSLDTLAAAFNSECINYCTSNGLKYKDEMKSNPMHCSEAANNGHLDKLKYFLCNGFKASKNICVDAAAGGQIRCLKFLHQSGFELSEDALNAAKMNNDVSCVNYCTNPHLYDLKRSKVRRKRKASEALSTKESSV